MNPMPFLMRELHAPVEGPIRAEKTQVAVFNFGLIIAILHQFGVHATYSWAKKGGKIG